MGTLDGKIAIVTGGNSGIGLETARGLAQQGAHVVVAVRNMDKGQAAADDIKQSTGNDKVTLLKLDLASLASVRQAAETFLAEHDRLDLLINNAGLYQRDRRLTADGFETTFGVNHLGPFLFTNLLVDVLKKTAAQTRDVRVVNVASAAHAFVKSVPFDDLMAEKKYVGFRAYGLSKLANILFSHALAKRLEGSFVVSHAVHPGTVRTGIGQGEGGPAMAVFSFFSKLFFLTPVQGAQTSLHCALSDEAGRVTGKYWAKSKVAKAKFPSDPDVLADRLWTVSEELTGLSEGERAAA